MKQRIDNNLFRNAYAVMVEDEMNENVFQPSTSDERLDRHVEYYKNNIKDYWEQRVLDTLIAQMSLTYAETRIFEGLSTVYVSEDFMFDLDKLKPYINIVNDSTTAYKQDNIYAGEVDGYKILIIDFGTYNFVLSSKPFDLEFFKKYLTLFLDY